MPKWLGDTFGILCLCCGSKGLGGASGIGVDTKLKASAVLEVIGMPACFCDVVLPKWLWLRASLGGAPNCSGELEPLGGAPNCSCELEMWYGAPNCSAVRLLPIGGTRSKPVELCGRNGARYPEGGSGACIDCRGNEVVGPSNAAQLLATGYVEKGVAAESDFALGDCVPCTCGEVDLPCEVALACRNILDAKSFKADSGWATALLPKIGKELGPWSG